MNASTSTFPSSSTAVERADRRAARAPFLPFRPISLRTAGLATLVGTALVIPSLHFLAWMPPVPGALVPTDGAALATGILIHVLLGPAFEELAYRGLLLQLGRRYLPAGLAVAVSTTAFAVPHLSKSVGIALLTVPAGVLLSWMVMRSSSLLPGFLCHLTFNLLAIMACFGWQVSSPGAVPSYPAIAGQFPLWTSVPCLLISGFAVRALAREFARRAPIA